TLTPPHPIPPSPPTSPRGPPCPGRGPASPARRAGLVWPRTRGGGRGEGTMSHAWRRLIGRVGGVWLQPETRRGLRAVAAVGAPLLLGMDGRLPLPVPFVLLAALEVSLLDVRGPYPLRIGYALALVLMLAVAAELGSLTGGALSPALFGTLLIAVHAGLWRH